jgi:hypothetical protein
LVCDGKLRAAAADRLLVGFKKTLPDKISERVADLALRPSTIAAGVPAETNTPIH